MNWRSGNSSGDSDLDINLRWHWSGSINRLQTLWLGIVGWFVTRGGFRFRVILGGSPISEPRSRVALLASVFILLSNCSNEATKPFTVRSPFSQFIMCARRKQRTGLEMILQLCLADGSSRIKSYLHSRQCHSAFSSSHPRCSSALFQGPNGGRFEAAHDDRDDVNVSPSSPPSGSDSWNNLNLLRTQGWQCRWTPMMNNIRLVVELVVPLLAAAAAVVVTAPGRLQTIGGIN